MFYVYECSGCMYVCALTCVSDACKVQKMMLESLKQELERVITCASELKPTSSGRTATAEPCL